jgi:hypothetical protein
LRIFVLFWPRLLSITSKTIDDSKRRVLKICEKAGIYCRSVCFVGQRSSITD